MQRGTISAKGMPAIEHHDRRVAGPDEHHPEGEIDEVHDAEDERQAERKERVGRADAQRIDDVLEERASRRRGRRADAEVRLEQAAVLLHGTPRRPRAPSRRA